MISQNKRMLKVGETLETSFVQHFHFVDMETESQKVKQPITYLGTQDILIASFSTVLSIPHISFGHNNEVGTG